MSETLLDQMMTDLRNSNVGLWVEHVKITMRGVSLDNGPWASFYQRAVSTGNRAYVGSLLPISRHQRCFSGRISPRGRLTQLGYGGKRFERTLQLYRHGILSITLTVRGLLYQELLARGTGRVSGPCYFMSTKVFSAGPLDSNRRDPRWCMVATTKTTCTRVTPSRKSIRSVGFYQGHFKSHANKELVWDPTSVWSWEGQEGWGLLNAIIRGFPINWGPGLSDH
jgi:hypothetical protein